MTNYVRYETNTVINMSNRKFKSMHQTDQFVSFELKMTELYLIKKEFLFAKTVSTNMKGYP